eukprot:2550237-Karenia_brevis.AAC.1
MHASRQSGAAIVAIFQGSGPSVHTQQMVSLVCGNAGIDKLETAFSLEALSVWVEVFVASGKSRRSAGNTESRMCLALTKLAEERCMAPWVEKSFDQEEWEGIHRSALASGHKDPIPILSGSA